jgi:hypothetical protein
VRVEIFEHTDEKVSNIRIERNHGSQRVFLRVPLEMRCLAVNLFSSMKGKLKIESVILIAAALLISSCGSEPDLPSASDSVLPTPPQAPTAPESGEGGQLVRPGDAPANSGQAQ